MEVDAEGFEFGSHTGGKGTVGDDGVEFVDVRYMHETALVEFGRIEDGNHFVCLLDHDLIEKCFFEVMGRDAIFDGEGIDAKEEFVAAEVTHRGEREGSDDRKAVVSDTSAQEYHFEAFVAHQFGSYIDGVGDDS